MKPRVQEIEFRVHRIVEAVGEGKRIEDALGSSPGRISWKRAQGSLRGAGCRGTNKGAARHRNGCCDSGDGFGQGHFSCIVLAHGAHSNDKKKEKASNVILI